MLYHADLYRLTPAEVADLGFEETGLDGVLAVEWPDRWTAQPSSAIRVVIDDQAALTGRSPFAAEEFAIPRRRATSRSW